MGWYGTYQALVNGRGTVNESLTGEADSLRTFCVALRKINEIKPVLDRRARARLAYWRRRMGCTVDVATKGAGIP